MIVELKSIEPSFKLVSISTLAVNIAGPLMSTLLPVTLIVVISPPRLIAVPAVKVTALISVPTVPPRVIVPPSVPFEAPATIVISSFEVSSTPTIFPAIVTVSLLVVATISKSPVVLRAAPEAPWFGLKVRSLFVLILMPASVVISPAAVIVVAPPKLN